MCGLLGFLSGYAGKPRRSTFEAVVADTATRGKHAWGVAWVETRGKAEVIRHYKQAGDVRNHVELAWSMVRNATAFILHTRWATHGGTGNIDNHPHAVDGGWLVHNGVISNYRDIKAEVRGHMSDCDSETLCRLIEKNHGRLPDRVRDAVDATRGNLAIAALWKSPLCLIIARRGNPLSVGRMDDGLWFSSLGNGFNGLSVSDDTLIEYRYRGGLPMVYRKRALQPGHSVKKTGGHYDPSGRLISTPAPAYKPAKLKPMHDAYTAGMNRLPVTQVIRPNRITEDDDASSFFGIESDSQYDVGETDERYSDVRLEE